MSTISKDELKMLLEQAKKTVAAIQQLVDVLRIKNARPVQSFAADWDAELKKLKNDGIG